MSTNINIEIRGIRELERAMAKSPRIVIEEANDLVARSMAAVRRIIWNNPWRVGQGGGGVPVLTGNLRQAHRTIFSEMKGSIGPDTRVAPYAAMVHDGSADGKIRGRPWLEHAKREAEPEIARLAKDFLQAVRDKIAQA